MMMRTAGQKSRRKPWLAAAFLFASFPAAAEEVMTADAAREFVAGRFFTYQCFDGTYGAGRIFNDGSAAGTIRVTGRGSSHYLRLPTSTLYVSGAQICARLKGLPFEPCFNLVKTGPESFRGSLSQLGFMYCNFKRGAAAQLVHKRGTSERKKHKAEEHKAEKAAEKKAEAKTEVKPEEKAEAKPEQKTEKKIDDNTDDMKLRR